MAISTNFGLDAARIEHDLDQASLAAVRLLREGADFERRLRHLNTHAANGEQAYLADAYRRALRLRRELLGFLPPKPDPVPDPWRGA